MLGTEIVLTNNPRGNFLEGIISGSNILPGTMMTLKPAVSPVLGRYTWIAGWSGADNDPRLTTILNTDYLQGQIYSQVYTTGTRCFMYCPLPGDELNVLLEGEQGTGSANAFTIGERLSARASTGLWYQQLTSSAKAPFMCMEHLDEVPNTATLAHCMMQ